MTEKAFYITTPLYYVNGAPHVGHAYATIGADVLARFQRARGRKVFLLTGTDEHGLKVEKASKELGYASPQALADAMVLKFKDAWKVFDITYDRFLRTTDADHKAAATQFWQRVEKAGFIEKREYEGWYCIHEETFWPSSQLVQPGNLCPECQRPTSLSKEVNFFFKQTAFTEKMKAHIAAHPGFVAPELRLNEILGSYLNAKDGVHDQSISRSNFKWGIPVPGDPEQVIYVWFDALINYLTATGWPEEGYTAMWPADVHILGKDILRFHAVLWPSMLLAAGVELPKKVFASGLIMNEGKKMSKSLDNFVDPLVWAERYGAEVLRYYLLREIPFGHDGSISEAGLQERYEKELANELGNLLSRTLGMAEKYLAGKVPDRPHDGYQGDALRMAVVQFGPAYVRSMEALAFHQALNGLMALAREANGYVDHQAPWAKFKLGAAGKQELELIMYNLLDALRVLAVGIAPFMPAAAARMLGQLGFSANSLLDEKNGACTGKTLDQLMEWGGLEPGTKVAKGEGLFPRRDLAAAAAG